MTITIEGEAFPLGVINANGEGIPFSEADNALKSLQTSVVRICTRSDPHICDAFGDPNSEIGHVVKAWRDGDSIMCRAEITDSIAAQKIEDGVWTQAWSIYAAVSDVDSGGWAHGVVIQSISIVNNPAWESARWVTVAASEDGKRGLRKVSKFKIIAASNNGDGSIPEEKNDEDTVAELEQKLKDANELINELKPKAEAAENVEQLTQQVAEVTASNKKLKKELEEQTALVASLQKGKAGSVTLEEAQNLVASALEDYKKEVLAQQEWNNAMAAFSASRDKLGLKTNPEDFKNLSASDLNKLAKDLGGVQLAANVEGGSKGGAGFGASGQIPYPSDDPSISTGPSIQIYDPMTKSFSDYKGE